MADTAEKPSKDAGATRRQIVVKAALATFAIAALVAALVMFESRQQEHPEPAPVAKVTTPITREEPPQASTDQPADSALGDQSAPQSAPGAEPALPTAEPSSAPSAVPEESADPTAGALSGAPDAVQEKSTAPRLVLRGEPPARRPTPSEMATPPAAQRSQAVPVSGGYFVQVGVFANYTNAEELRTRLTENGIPAHLETRVQVGPFANKKDAVAAQRKLRDLGVDGGMVITNRK